MIEMDFLGKNLNKMRPRRRSIGTIVPPNLQSIPDNDKPVESFENAEEKARIDLVRKQSKRRASCPAGPKVSFYFKWRRGGVGVYY